MDSTLRIFSKPILLHDIEKFSTLAQYGCSQTGAVFFRLSNQNITLIRIRDKMEALGEKNENLCFKNFPGVPG
jgi:hypothetical protein